MDWVATWGAVLSVLERAVQACRSDLAQVLSARARDAGSSSEGARRGRRQRRAPLKRAAPWSEGQRQRSYLRAGNNASSEIGLERALLEQAEEDPPRRGRGVAGGQSTSCDGRCSQ
jgi:hypothetical protein